MTDILRTIIVPSALAGRARELGKSLSAAGDGMYKTGASPTGESPATHFISSGWIGEDFADLLPLTTVTPATAIGGAETVTKTAGKPAVLFGAATQRATALDITLTATQANVTALLSESDVSDQPPFVALARLGLQLVRGKL